MEVLGGKQETLQEDEAHEQEPGLVGGTVHEEKHGAEPAVEQDSQGMVQETYKYRLGNNSINISSQEIPEPEQEAVQEQDQKEGHGQEAVHDQEEGGGNQQETHKYRSVNNPLRISSQETREPDKEAVQDQEEGRGEENQLEDHEADLNRSEYEQESKDFKGHEPKKRRSENRNKHNHKSNQEPNGQEAVHDQEEGCVIGRQQEDQESVHNRSDYKTENRVQGVDTIITTTTPATNLRPRPNVVVEGGGSPKSKTRDKNEGVGIKPVPPSKQALLNPNILQIKRGEKRKVSSLSVFFEEKERKNSESGIRPTQLAKLRRTSATIDRKLGDRISPHQINQQETRAELSLTTTQPSSAHPQPPNHPTHQPINQLAHHPQQKPTSHSQAIIIAAQLNRNYQTNQHQNRQKTPNL